MAPVESFTHTNEFDKKPLALVRPGEEVKPITFEQAQIIVTCDSLDFNGTVEVQTPEPETIGIFLFESSTDLDPKPLETGQKYHFSGTQRIEIHSTKQDEFISLEHKVAAGVSYNIVDDLLSKRARSLIQPVSPPKPVLVGAASK